MEQTNSNAKKFNGKVAVLLGLLFIALVAGGLHWSNSTKVTAENKVLNDQVESLEETRAQLLQDIASLQSDYDFLVQDNAALETDYEEISQEIDAQKVEIRKIKKAFATDATEMKSEIDQLKTIKSDLTGYINQLRAENAQLKQANKDLAVQVSDVEARNKVLELEISQLKQLTGQLEKDRSNLMATATRATDLRIDIRKKGDKPTGSFRRAKEISVSFAISNLPSTKKGDQKVYVVIKDAQGVPIKVANPIKATIKSEVSGQSEEIIAQQMELRNLFEKTRFQMKVAPLAGTLNPGYYRAVVYTDWGILGGAQFHLR